LSAGDQFVINTVFLPGYQWRNDPVTGINELLSVFFQPQFYTDYVAAMFVFSVVTGITYSARAFLLIFLTNLRAVMRL
jgi:hypothetical protein